MKTRSKLSVGIGLAIGLGLSSNVLLAQHTTESGLLAETDSTSDGTSPVRRIQRPPFRVIEPAPVPRYRSFDGSGNNQLDPSIGAVGNPLLRIMPAAYSDGVSQLAGTQRRSAREISNIVVAQSGSILNPDGATDFLWQWGQFVDHDIDLTDGADPQELENIAVPVGDIYFDPNITGTEVITFNRSIYDVNSGTGANNPRQQLNEITSWIDASNVYGSDSERALALRTLDGTGRLKTSEGRFLPFNEDGLSNAGGNSNTLFLAGDVRANEQIGLTVMHTLFMREHNRLANIIRSRHPNLSGEDIYHLARRLVSAEMQIITYREYLPALLGRGALAPYSGYHPERNASISNIFSTGPYRYGHSALSTSLLRLDQNGNTIPEGNLSLREAFFSPTRITEEGGIEPILRGLSTQVCQAIDPYVIDDVRNFLFGEPGEGGFDLASLNIQRGRDHGLPSYNQARAFLGLPRMQRIADISANSEIRHRLSKAYQHVDDIDVWVGGLAEDHLPGAQVGELIRAVVSRQFEALRDGDRFWYERDLTAEEKNMIENLRLADIIRLNTRIGSEISNNVFRIRSSERDADSRPPRRR